ncbi:MAG TPA: hypothetical protein VIZ90_00800 [Rhizobiaceae bacterium]
MRVQGIVILLAAFGAAEARASSIETVQALAGATPSFIALGGAAAVDPSIVAAVAETGPSPSIITLPDTPDSPSIVALGAPASADEAAATPSSRQPAPMVIRGGEVGSSSARASSAQTEAAAGSAEPLLDPDDRGTPAKRAALRRQAERLAREAAQDPKPDPSMEPAPLGR